MKVFRKIFGCFELIAYFCTIVMNNKVTIIAGPCVIESAELLDTVARKLVEINTKLGT